MGVAHPRERQGHPLLGQDAVVDLNHPVAGLGNGQHVDGQRPVVDPRPGVGRPVEGIVGGVHARGHVRGLGGIDLGVLLRASELEGLGLAADVGARLVQGGLPLDPETAVPGR